MTCCGVCPQNKVHTLELWHVQHSTQPDLALVGAACTCRALSMHKAGTGHKHPAVKSAQPVHPHPNTPKAILKNMQDKCPQKAFSGAWWAGAVQKQAPRCELDTYQRRRELCKNRT